MTPTSSRPLRFDGHIHGWGTSSGLRFVIGDWHRSPFGAFTDVMVAHPDGRRELLAPSDDVAELVAATYRFENVTVVPVVFLHEDDRRTVRAGPLEATFDVGGRLPWGYPLRMVPSVLTSPLLAQIMGPVARVVMPGVRTHGSASGGRYEYYVAHDLHRLSGLSAAWDGSSLGESAPVHPDPRFGFSSTPRRPCVTSVTTFIR